LDDAFGRRAYAIAVIARSMPVIHGTQFLRHSASNTSSMIIRVDRRARPLHSSHACWKTAPFNSLRILSDITTLTSGLLPRSFNPNAVKRSKT
jgi:hypothetical protein